MNSSWGHCFVKVCKIMVGIMHSYSNVNNDERKKSQVYWRVNEKFDMWQNVKLTINVIVYIYFFTKPVFCTYVIESVLSLIHHYGYRTIKLYTASIKADLPVLFFPAKMLIFLCN